MKNLVFSALALFAFAGSAFASNDKCSNLITEMHAKSEYFKPCNIKVWVTNPDGSKKWRDKDAGDLSWDECGNAKDKFLTELKNENLRFTDKDVTVIWGD